MAERIVTTAGELVRQFSHYSDVALDQPVVVTKNGRPRNVLISIKEYDRLRRNDRMVFMAEDTPQEFVADMKRQLAGKKKKK